jgi:hypothetical protein
MFGGSTMWGSGVSDDGTIPSHLAKDLLTRGWKNFEITNFGQPGYVSTQSLLALFLELRNGNRPDLVVFYDGFNDLFSSFQNGEAGIPQNEDNRRIEFNHARSFISVGVPDPPSFLVYLKKHSVLLSLLTTPSSKLVQPRSPSPPHPKMQALASETLATYFENMKFLEQLSATYHFALFTFWQPTLYSRSQYASGELAIRSSLEQQYGPNLEIFFNEGYRQMREKTKRPLHFHDLQEVLNDDPRILFTDFCHLTSDGNLIVAHAMAKVLGSSLDSRLTPTHEVHSDGRLPPGTLVSEW